MCVAAIVLIATALAATTVAAGGSVPPDLKGAILFKVLGHDRNLADRCRPSVNIGLFYDATNSESKQCRTTMGRVFGKLTSKTLADLPITFSEHSGSDVTTLKAAVASEEVNVAFFCTGLEGITGEVAAYAKDSGVVTLGDTEDMVKDGLAVGVGMKGMTAKIVVNQKAARAEGMDLDPRLLIIADVVE